MGGATPVDEGEPPGHGVPPAHPPKGLGGVVFGHCPNTATTECGGVFGPGHQWEGAPHAHPPHGTSQRIYSNHNSHF